MVVQRLTLVLLVKLALKIKMYNTIKLETTTIIVHYTVDEFHTNFLCVFKLGCVLLGKESQVFIWLQRGTRTSIAYKNL